MSRSVKAIVVGVVVVLSVLIALFANFLISSTKKEEKPTKTKTEQVDKKEEATFVEFGDTIDGIRVLDKDAISQRIQAFNETYDLGIEDTGVSTLIWKSSGVVVVNPMGKYEFLTDYYGTIVGFISRSGVSSSSLEKVSKSFSVISLGSGRVLYIGSITNGLVGRGGVPLVKIKKLNNSELSKDTKVELEKLPDIWSGLGVSSEVLEFSRFAVSPSGVEMAEYSDSNGNYFYYSLYSVSEGANQVVRGKFSGIMRKQYDPKITKLFVKNVAQFGIFEVKDGGVLWVTY